jgi:cytochrome c oxidase subunit IV
MKLTPPKQVTFYIAVLIFVLGIVAALVPALKMSGYAVWVVSIAFLLLAIANTTKGL